MSPGPQSVLLVHSSSGRYGADRQLRLLAGGLDRSRYAPLVVLPSEGPLAEDLAGDGVEVLIRPLAVIRRELVHPRGLAALSARVAGDAIGLGRIVRSRRVALVHSNTSVILGGAAASALLGVPHVWHVREIYDRFAGAWPAYRALLQTARALPCVSGATAAQFRSERAHVVHDGLAALPRRTPRKPARAALRLDADAPVIAVLGRISEWKGQDVLVRALAEPPLRERQAVAVLAGEAWPGSEQRATGVRELAEALGVAQRVRMLGFRDDLEIVLGAADVVAVPSSSPDPLPGAAIEAAAAGCVVLASAHGGLPEIIRDGSTGRLVPPRDPAALAAMAAELLDDPEQRARLGAAAARDIPKRFSAARLLAAIQDLYDSLLVRRGR